MQPKRGQKQHGRITGRVGLLVFLGLMCVVVEAEEEGWGYSGREKKENV